MPYITKTEQERVDTNPYYGRSTREHPGNPGILNYRISKVLFDWLGSNPLYRDFNAAIGALESAKLELYRRSIGPYEDQAIDRNGDVYPPQLLPQPHGIAEKEPEGPDNTEDQAYQDAPVADRYRI